MIVMKGHNTGTKLSACDAHFPFAWQFVGGPGLTISRHSRRTPHYPEYLPFPPLYLSLTLSVGCQHRLWVCHVTRLPYSTSTGNKANLLPILSTLDLAFLSFTVPIGFTARGLLYTLTNLLIGNRHTFCYILWLHISGGTYSLPLY